MFVGQQLCASFKFWPPVYLSLTVWLKSISWNISVDILSETLSLRILPTFLTNPNSLFPQEDLRIGSVFSVMPSSLPLAPAANPVSLHMSCSHCNKSLIKGQTAFQRKGSPALFCTTSCLTASLTALKPSKVCQNCLRWIRKEAA